ncbi:MAG TPA: carboxypeptidase regulatory-like domain-containing protein [Terriglobales bacterium]|jgi:hypothetical protein
MIKRIHFLCLLMSLLPSSLWAQSSISGKATAGPNATPIAGVRISLRASSQEYSTQSDAQGTYSFTGIASGSYALTFQSEGLRPFEKTDVQVGDGDNLHIDANLALANVRESVVVNGEVVNLQTSAAEINQTFTSQELTDLPVVTNSTTKAARLNPHVRQTIGLGSDYQDSTRLSINAGSYRNTGYMLDGIINYDWVYSVSPQAVIAPSAVEEMNVMTGQYPAQVGVSTTGVLDIHTKSGGDEYHGQAFAYIRPSGLQSNPPVAVLNSPTAPNTHVPNEREYWGASVGGPLIADRTYFFASYEQSLQDRGAFIQSPTERFVTGHTSDYYGLLRFDHKFTETNSLTARFNGNHYEGNNVNDRISGFNQPSTGRFARVQAWGGQISDLAVIGRTVNQARFSFEDFFPDSATPLDPSVGVVRPNYSTEGYSTYNWVHAQTYNFADTVMFRRGRHSFQVGGEVNNIRARDFSKTLFGTYTFDPGPPQPGEHPTKFSQTFGVQDLHYNEAAINGFVQDEIRITPQLTANLGLRYEYQTLTDDRNNFAPRAALAWDARGDGRTLVRVGAGIFYDQYYLYIYRRFITLGANAPTASYTLNYGDPAFPTFPQSLTAPPAGASLGSRNLYIAPDQLLNPYAMQFTASLQQELAKNVVLTISGMHEHTVKQMRVDDINHPAPYPRTFTTPSRSGSVADATRPLTTFDGVPVRDVAVIQNNAGAIYQALDVGLDARVNRWLQLSGHYVFASSATYAMFYADANSGVPSEWWPNWDRLERAPDDFYQRSRFVGTAFIDLPWRSQLALVGNAGSGLPVNPITGKDDNGDTYATDRPAGFGRNSFRTPPQASLDVALAKTFRVREKLNVEGRIQAFNVLNNQNHLVVNNIYGEGPKPPPTFLQALAGITNSDPSRQIEFAVRLIF